MAALQLSYLEGVSTGYTTTTQMITCKKIKNNIFAILLEFLSVHALGAFYAY
jgi:hypothetical protein